MSMLKGLMGVGLMAVINVAAAEWTPLFNGQDLSGWSIQCVDKDKGKDYWSVQEGAILVDSIGHTDHDYMWCMSDGEYADFELKLSFQILEVTQGNSGVQIRSRYDAKAGWLDGPQLDIHPATPMRAGLIYDETRDVKRWIFPDLEPGNHTIPKEQTNPNVKLLYGTEQWNKMYIIAKGTIIKCYVNGELTAQYDGAGVLDDALHQKYGVGMKGHIALQLHRKNSIKMRFTDIRIREL